MTGATLTLADFLLARIAEDEAAAPLTHDMEWRTVPGEWQRGPIPDDMVGVTVHVRPCGMGKPSGRMLVDCEAKRRIVEQCAPHHVDEPYNAPSSDVEVLADSILCALALPYADHPDYREEWRP